MKNRSAADAIVRRPMPRPNPPWRLCRGAIEAAVAITHRAMAARTSHRRMRSGRSGAGRGARRVRISHATAVAATKVVRAHTLGSSYGPAADGRTASGTPSTTDARPMATAIEAHPFQLGCDPALDSLRGSRSRLRDTPARAAIESFRRLVVALA